MSLAAIATSPWASSDTGDLDFTEADVQIYVPQAGTLAIMRDALRNQGFRRITVHTKIEQLANGLATAPADLVLTDIDQAPAEVCEVVRDIRFRRVGKNPFVGVVALSGGMDQQRASLVLRSGIDDILLSPISANSVSSRLSRLVLARKPFVGTPTYIGPDRRSPDRAIKHDIPLLDAPNALRMKALRIQSEPITANVEGTYRTIGCQQVEHMGVTIRTVVAELEDRSASHSEEAGRTRLTQLCAELADLTAHMKGQAYDDLVRMLDLTKAALVATTQAEELNATRLEVLRLHGDSLIAVQRSDGALDNQLETGLQRAVASVGRRSKSEGRYIHGAHVPAAQMAG